MNYLFVVAHPDDESVNCGGSILKFLKEGHKVHIHCMTGGETTGTNKKNIIKDLYPECNVIIEDFPDQQLDTVDTLLLNKTIADVIDSIKPDYVYTHTNKDLNKDHRIISSCVLIATRPTPDNNIKGVYTFGNIDDYSFNQFGNFNKNMFVSFDKEIANKKIEKCLKYIDDIKQDCHPRSKENIKIRDAYIGSLCGKPFAEAFETIYSIDTH